jgi:hypothetical protein
MPGFIEIGTAVLIALYSVSSLGGFPALSVFPGQFLLKDIRYLSCSEDIMYLGLYLDARRFLKAMEA